MQLSDREPSTAVKPVMWEELEQLIATGQSPERIEAYLAALPVGETARVLSRLTDDDRVRLINVLPADEAAGVIGELPRPQAVELLERLAAATAATLMHLLPSDVRADLLGEVRTETAEAILDAMHPEIASSARAMACYAPDTAGGLMITEYLAYPATATVTDVMDDLRAHADRYRNYSSQYAYVVDRERRLVGVLRLRDLLLARRTQPVDELMIRNPLAVRADAPLNELEAFFDERPFFAVPALDETGRLLGVVSRDAVKQAGSDRNVDDYRKAQGIIREELRSMPVLLRARRRLAWLSINIGLNVIAASVIAVYQDTLASVIALAVFLPIISDMSGCSGNQAVAVTMRELTLGVLRPAEVMYVLGKEMLVGIVNGLALGALIAGVAWLWKGNVYLGLVVGAALALNTMVAVCFGGTIPLVLKRLRFDPALASGPVLTTVTDMCGFFLVLSFASMALEKLTGVA